MSDIEVIDLPIGGQLLMERPPDSPTEGEYLISSNGVLLTTRIEGVKETPNGSLLILRILKKDLT